MCFRFKKGNLTCSVSFNIFWNNEFSFEDNAVINYDWYHPQDCTRHTIEEGREWFTQNGLNITHESVDFYGITVKGIL
jgi:hypothetical protein